MSIIIQKAKEITTAALLTKIAAVGNCSDPELNKCIQQELDNIKNGKPRKMFAKLTTMVVALNKLEELIETSNEYEIRHDIMEINDYEVMLLKQLELEASNLRTRLE